jgi:hypothetical protein
MYTGRCLCGAVRLEITGGIRHIIKCHCSQCRKAQGGAFAVNGIVAEDEFAIVQGANNLTAYESAPGKQRFFCRTCGSPIMSKNTAAPGQIRIRLGTIESDIQERPMAHIFVSSRANWDEITDDLPQYDSYEPGR